MNENILFETIRYHLKQTASWRTELAGRFKEDFRNVIAAKRLSELSDAPFEEIDGRIWMALETHSISPGLSRAVNEAARDIGFRSCPRNISDLVQSIATKLSS